MVCLIHRVGFLSSFVASYLGGFMVSVLLIVVGLYVAIGLAIGLAFVLRGVNRIDVSAGDSPFIFRVVILPGCVGLWPVVLLKWINAGKGARA